MGWYITIQQEMRESLELKGNELIVFAFINGYSQEGQGCFNGSLAYLQKVCGIASRQTAIDVLKSLTSKGYIHKTETIQNGVKYVSYSVCPKIGQGVQNLDRGCPIIGHNNKRDINISSIDIEDNSHKPFPFKKSLIEIGVSEEVAAAWMEVRKKKRATNSEIAFNALRREIAKSGMAPDDAVRLAVEKSWSGFDSAWVLKEKNVAPKREREDNFQRTMRAAKQLFGDNDPFFNFKKQDIDEQ